MTHFIVPIDLVSDSVKAINLAGTMAYHMNGEVNLLLVLPPNSKNNEKEAMHRTKAEKNLLLIYNKFKSQMPGLPIVYTIREGEVENELIDYVNSYSEAIVILTTEGISEFQSFVGNDVTNKVISAVNNPVITIKPTDQVGTINTIVLPIDHTKESREKVPFVTLMAAALNAKVKVVSVSTTKSIDINNHLVAYLKQVCDYLSLRSINYEAEQLEGNNIADLIVNYSIENSADIIAVMTKQEKDFTNLFKGSYMHQLVNKSPVPLLLYPTTPIGITPEFYRSEVYDFS